VTTYAAPVGPHLVSLRYTQAAHIVVEGPVTHRRYEFSAGSSIQAVDSADASGLLATRFFERA
jgi:hypothetical protein